MFIEIILGVLLGFVSLLVGIYCSSFGRLILYKDFEIRLQNLTSLLLAEIKLGVVLGFVSSLVGI